MIEIPAGPATLGRARGDGFGWDNEFERHQVRRSGLRHRQHKVTNGDYLEFVKAGAAAPHFWACREGQWCYHGMFDDIPLPLDWPVYVSYDEAQAYARWKGDALPTEAQFHRAAYDGGPMPSSARRERGFSSLGSRAGHRFAAEPYRRFAMVGNGWEWTATPLRAVRRLPAFLRFIPATRPISSMASTTC